MILFILVNVIDMANDILVTQVVGELYLLSLLNFIKFNLLSIINNTLQKYHYCSFSCCTHKLYNVGVSFLYFLENKVVCVI